MKTKKIYVAGPMSGHVGLNWDNFDRIANQLRHEGWIAVNPADLDREQGVNPSQEMAVYDYTACALRDVEALLECNAIYLMDGWQYSRGASWERALAKHHNIRRFYETPRLKDF